MISSSFFRELQKRCLHRWGDAVIAIPEFEDFRMLAAVKILLEAQIFKRARIFLDQSRGLEVIHQSGIDFRHYQKSLEWVGGDGNLGQEVKKRIANNGKIKDKSQIDFLIASPLYQAGHLLEQGQADVVLAGLQNPTAQVIRAALTTVSLAEGCRYLSGSFLMLGDLERWKEKRFLFADAAVNVDPNVHQLVDIAAASVETWSQVFQQPPVVAFLSFSTLGSANHANVEKVREARQVFYEKYPMVKSFGDVQLDAAINSDIGRAKGLCSSIAGRGNILIFPNLDAGNICYKMAQEIGGYSAFGPLLQGLKYPYCDLSRGASTRDIVFSAMLSLLRKSTNG